MPLPLTVSCFSKIQIDFTFLVLAYPGSPGKGPLKGCVCVLLTYGRTLYIGLHIYTDIKPWSWILARGHIIPASALPLEVWAWPCGSSACFGLGWCCTTTVHVHCSNIKLLGLTMIAHHWVATQWWTIIVEYFIASTWELCKCWFIRCALSGTGSDAGNMWLWPGHLWPC